MINSSISILWFRQDLRLIDNPALMEACLKGSVMPIFILDDESAGEWKYGGASRWFLYEALNNLSKQLEHKLSIFQGDAKTIIPKLIKKVGASSIYWNRCYEPWCIKRDAWIKGNLKSEGITVKTFNASLLWEPWEVLKKDGSPYKVFTPFYRKGCLMSKPPRFPHDTPVEMNFLSSDDCTDLNTLGLKPSSDWFKKLENFWDASTKGALSKLSIFLDSALSDYREGRNFPSRKCVSFLSPYLRYGLVSPNIVWHAALSANPNNLEDKNLDTFLSELGWREFSYYLLFHFPDLPTTNLQKKFDRFPWRSNAQDFFEKWKWGLTGYPLIDAGMRELYETGYMHNRLRMVVGSFLVKNLLIDWRYGEQWFWDCLVDADLASNSAGWQWIAGCGADAAPYFRIFNPITQSEKFDSEGIYIKQHVPELSGLPSKYIHAPWQAPESILRESGVELGNTYPYPIVDIKESRQQALDAFAQTKM